MRAVLLIIVLGACGPASAPSRRAQPATTAPTSVLDEAAPPAGGKTRFCVVLTDSGGFDCQPTAERCEEYAVFLEGEGYVVEAATRCQSRPVVCADYAAAHGAEELCGRDLDECERDRKVLESEEVTPGSVGPCQ